ncbi:hypothetical protein VTH06DRAFT_3509 [Thermothelomyces fergusii]
MWQFYSCIISGILFIGCRTAPGIDSQGSVPAPTRPILFLPPPAPCPQFLPSLALYLGPPPPPINLAGGKRRSISSHGGLLNRMFGSGSNSGGSKSEKTEGDSVSDPTSGAQKDRASSSPPSPDRGETGSSSRASPLRVKPSDHAASGEKRSGGNGGSPNAGSSAEQKKRRSSGVSGKASSLIAHAKHSLFTQVGSRANSDQAADSKSSDQTPLQKLGKQDQALAVPQGQHNNAAGESHPGPRSTFRVGVWEDRNKKCRRTMEDTHAFLYNFLHTPAPAVGTSAGGQAQARAGTAGDAGGGRGADGADQDMIETDNGYFAIFDGHAGTFAADWCGKKLHIILEDIIRKHPNAPIPELLDQTFTAVDAQLGQLPLKNSGCTAAIAILRWEDRRRWRPRMRPTQG